MLNRLKATLALKLDQQDRRIAYFFLKSLALYLAWYFLYEEWWQEDGSLDNFLINHLVYVTDFCLQTLGYTTFTYADAVGVDGTHGVLIGVPCNGLSLFALFAGFIIAFPGRRTNKLWFIPLGMVVVHVLNIIRLVGLALIVLYRPDSLAFNHKYTFTIFVYGCIFLLWMLWVKYFAQLTKR